MCVQGLRDALNGAEITADMVAPSTLGEKCWVRWPYLQVRFKVQVPSITAHGPGLVRFQVVRQSADVGTSCPGKMGLHLTAPPPRCRVHELNAVTCRLNSAAQTPNPALQEALVFAVSDRNSQLSRGDGGGVQSQRHAPAEADEWAFLNTKLTNDAVTQQAWPPTFQPVSATDRACFIVHSNHFRPWITMLALTASSRRMWWLAAGWPRVVGFAAGAGGGAD